MKRAELGEQLDDCSRGEGLCFRIFRSFTRFLGLRNFSGFPSRQLQCSVTPAIPLATHPQAATEKCRKMPFTSSASVSVVRWNAINYLYQFVRS